MPLCLPQMEKTVPAIQKLYPRLNEQEFKEAEDTLDRYLALVLRIFERLESETRPQADQLISCTGTLGCTAPESEAST